MTDFAGVEERLRAILEPYRDRLVVVADGPGGVSLHLPGLADKPHGYVAGIRPGKRYVSLYLMPLYAFPELGDGMSPALGARRQGKSCFNFSKVEEPLLDELTDLARRGIDRYEEAVAAGVGPFLGDARFGPARAALASQAR
jgi:hypothetical protein